MSEVTEVAQTYLGNINHNPELANTITTKSYLKLSLSASDRSKGRIHGYTTSGLAVGIIKSRDRSLDTGDLYQTDSGKLLLIDLEEQELLVIDLATINNVSPAKLVQLGHVLGNHHYPVKIEDNILYVQLVTDKTTVEKLINTIGIIGLQIKYHPLANTEAIAFAHNIHH